MTMHTQGLERRQTWPIERYFSG